MSAPHHTPLVVLGGTFDPPHLGHLVVAQCASHQFGANVVFMPAGDPWRKTAAEVSPRDVAPASHRLQMVRLAIDGNPAFLVDEREVYRHGPTYTIDTLRELHAEGHRDIILVLGMDSLIDLPNWREPDAIRAAATIAVAPRLDVRPTDGDVVAIDMPPLAISATDIRERVATDRPVRYLVPPAVESYIRANRLYRA